MIGPVTVCGICDIAGCVHTKGEVMSDYDPKCADCGAPASNHPYRHPFVGRVPTLADAAARIKDLEAKLEAMTLQHAAALEAVAKARGAALREAAEVVAKCTPNTIAGMIIGISYHAAILALINKGDSRE